MPNNSVRAAAEGMPAINRRQALAMSAGGLATAITVLSVKPAAAAVVQPAKLTKLARLEAIFNEEWRKHQESLPAYDAAERAYYAKLGRLVRPTMAEDTPEEKAAFQKLTVGDLRDWANRPNPRRAEYNAALRAYNRAATRARSTTGLAKIDRDCTLQLDRTIEAANRVLHCPAHTIEDLVVKARVHRVWEFGNEGDLDFIIADIVRVAGKGGAA
ncbi:hypothetical protein FJ955_03165 [Mesorhizobium sp. B2-2-2]|uniref:hypothetical protein n=1 Tax=Mesorhizobium sp. B2-2-2 TaxID=2589964 RepID=UPI00112DEDF3|nr:hypothetical protein [Mesorhizobium sp. B2-2-2]TPM33753.1 hypothetical protein FJ955_03165 [Mesorhizobium sp. B2-2-2]